VVSLSNFYRPRQHRVWPFFVANRRIMTGWSILAHRARTRAIVRFMRYRANRVNTEGQSNLVLRQDIGWKTLLPLLDEHENSNKENPRNREPGCIYTIEYANSESSTLL
jgi:hypothetical protein